MSHGMRQKLDGLQKLAQMVLDAQLAELRAIARARETCLAQLADLNRPFPEGDLHPMVVAEAELRFQRWADLRRAEINQILARKNVELEEARGAAGLAFGRAQALARLREAAGR
jgi:hypothetical protein